MADHNVTGIKCDAQKGETFCEVPNIFFPIDSENLSRIYKSSLKSSFINLFRYFSCRLFDGRDIERT